MSWKHPKYKTRKYIGRYKEVNGSRIFVLECKLKNGELDSKSFSSFYVAKKHGWVK